MVSRSTVLGAAGEHYVMCQLLRRGLIAALAPVGVPNTDIIVTDDIGDLLRRTSSGSLRAGKRLLKWLDFRSGVRLPSAP